MSHPWNIQGQVVQGSEKPDLVENVPAYWGGGGVCVQGKGLDDDH